MNNIVATKTIAAFSINLSDWFYEGQLVDVTDKSTGLLRNALIESINEDSHTFIVSHAGRSYTLSMTRIENITSVNRRRIAV